VNPIVVRREHRLDDATARRMVETIAGRMRREFGGTFCGSRGRAPPDTSTSV